MPIRQQNTAYLVTPALMTAFARTVSPERWRTYERAAGFSDDLAHRLYLWNAAIGQSFHFPLQTAEVALRNVIHCSLVSLYGANWCADQGLRKSLKPQQLGDLLTAEQRYYRIHRRNPNTPQTVASLSFGFWVALLRRHYNGTIWMTQTATAFPNLKSTETIVDVSKTGTLLQDFRNRIFHQEPLIGRNLSQDYANILKMLEWICLETRDWMRANSSVPAVIRQRPR